MSKKTFGLEICLSGVPCASRDEHARSIACHTERRNFVMDRGVWQMLLPERQEYYQQFIREYETIRKLKARNDPT
jgi:hypothetical protein